MNLFAGSFSAGPPTTEISAEERQRIRELGCKLTLIQPLAFSIILVVWIGLTGWRRNNHGSRSVWIRLLTKGFVLVSIVPVHLQNAVYHRRDYQYAGDH